MAVAPGTGNGTLPVVVIVTGGAWVLRRYSPRTADQRRAVELGFHADPDQMKPVYVYVDGMRAMSLLDL